MTRKAVRCDRVRRPASFAGPGVLTVYTVDMGGGLPAVDADAVFSGGETVYGSASSLYVATQRYDEGTYEPGTMIHRFDITEPERTTYAASGFVAGTLLNQFSLSEDKGILRAASTRGFGSDSESRVTTLQQDGGYLVPRGKVDGLGKGERIYAVRFIGDAGYVVTFRQTDPLYTLDLSDPSDPRVRGELKIPGYSAYLHPVGDGLLLGIGQDADASTGMTEGLQISLFDVGDLAKPARLQQLRLGERFSSSAVEWNHHAFLWWPATKLAMLPVDSEGFVGAAGFTVDRAGGIAELGRISHPVGRAAGRRRSSGRAVVRGRLFTVSDHGVRASALSDLQGDAWAAFPDPPPVYPPDTPVPMPRDPGRLEALPQHPEDPARDLPLQRLALAGAAGSRRWRRRPIPRAPAPCAVPASACAGPGRAPSAPGGPAPSPPRLRPAARAGRRGSRARSARRSACRTPPTAARPSRRPRRRRRDPCARRARPSACARRASARPSRRAA